MKNLILLILAASALFTSCRPDPINISVPQRPGQLAISSACINDSVIYVSASYSINSLRNIMDTTNTEPIPRDMVVDSGLVTITPIGSSIPDTLNPIRPGLYATYRLKLTAGTSYNLQVTDLRKGTKASATTLYLPKPQIDTLYPECTRTPHDSIVRMRIKMLNTAPNSYYTISYATMREARKSVGNLSFNSASLYNFTPKQVELFSTDAYTHGAFEKSVTLQVNATDTIIVHVGQIDRSYYGYLDAYKRTGSLINQLTGEPINLPNNIKPGFGYFSLYRPIRRAYDLNKY